ncbi:MAG TPA: gliding motility-associated ABC transporter ATP-binding subunit GldA [Bacteroidales bacterium]|nr:gliding motility-associated ABC transporter ATP-binding subunit GldA [Bacteroidales bacterium]
MSIVVENVSKRYGNQLALKEVSFNIEPDEIVGFIGPNGAGKSTMMKIICGFIPPTEGSVKVNGIEVSENPLLARKAIGYLPENNPLYYEMYVKEYLEFVSGILNISDKKARIAEIIKQTGLEAEKHKKIGALSKGYKQRVGIAQALIHDPAVVILDEPTTGLDPNQILEIRNLISETGRGKTIMLSTHIMQEVEAICSRIIVINNGEIVANDRAGNLKIQSQDNYNTVSVEFSSDVSLQKLERIGRVTKVVQVKANTYLLQSNATDDIRASIFQFAVEEGLTVLALQKIEKSLEEVFHELTAGK